MSEVQMREALEQIATEGTTTDREIAARGLGYEDWEHFDRRDLRSGEERNYAEQIRETLRWLIYYQAWLDGYERGRDDEAQALSLDRLPSRADESWQRRKETWGMAPSHGEDQA